MIPKLKKLTTAQAHYLAFMEELKSLPFSGDINPDFAHRVVLSTDNSIYQILPQGIVYPANESDLVTLCQLCEAKKYRDIVLSPRGGGTGTNGQSLTDGIVVDLSKYMNGILEINAEEKWVRVQSGVVKDQLNAALKPFGLFFAPELSTSNRATIGGMISTDASGQGSCLYGKTRDHVLELKTVLLDGSVLTSKALSDEDLDAICDQQDKIGLIHRLVNNIEREYKGLIEKTFPPLNRCLTGYDLAHIRDDNDNFNLNNILCGSEGTLGFLTEAKLNVLSIPEYTALVIVKYQDFDTSLRDAAELMKASPTSIETIDSKVLNLAMQDFIWHQVEAYFDKDDSTLVKGINLVEFASHDEQELHRQIEQFTKQLKNTTGQPAKRIGFSIARGRNSVNKIWAMRKRAVGLLGNAQGEARPIPFVEDTAVPPEHLADYIQEFREILDAYDLQYGMFGHVDAGVLHVRPALDMKNPESEKIAWEISDRVAELTQQYHGLLWGEHGKGLRSEYAPKFFGELYPQLQRIKAAFDPRNQINPGKIATPSKDIALFSIDSVPTRGQKDRNIPVKVWEQFSDAVYCNGNGACYNWNPNDAMCPSWKMSRDRVQSPKGRASLMREWMSLIAKTSAENTRMKSFSFWGHLNNLPEKIRSWQEKKRGEYDFSHEVYNSMSTCLACKSCAGQCPIKVNVPEFRSQFLELYHSRYFRPLKDYLVGSLEKFLPLCAKFPRLYNAITGLSITKLILEKHVGFVDGPSLSLTSLNALPVASAQKLHALSDDDKARTVVIVQDAFTSYFEAELIIDIFNLLKKLELNPMLAPYSPNGKPLHVHGFLSAFKKTAEKNARLLRELSECNVPLIGIDPSMTLTYQGEYRKYLPQETVPEVHLFQHWLAENINELKVPGAFAGNYKLMQHCTEQSNAAGSGKQWQKIFKAFGHSLSILELGCCGMSGTFGHEARNKQNSQTLYAMSWQEPVDKFGDSGQLVATGFSCRSQVKREAQKAIPHPAQVLLKAIE